jgi:glycosidase
MWKLSNWFRITLVLVLLVLGSSLRADTAVDYSRVSARSVPDWVRDGVIYEIFPRNFSSAGDFKGIEAKLDELKDLGVTILWLMPIHPSGKEKSKGTFGSPYAVRDYYAISPDYGTEADLKRLVTAAHLRKMKVIIDMVANHTAWDSVMMKHPEYYKQDSNGKIIPPVPEWDDVAGLNYTNNELREYMIKMLKYWVDPQGVNLDGFRCDAAEMVPTSFWEQARAGIIKTKPDIMLLAEGSKPELLTNAFDLDYGWPLMGTLNNVIMNSAPASDLKKSWEEDEKKFPKGALHMRISDDHDEPRAIARFGFKGAIAASAFMFMLDGVPLIYNGMEVGDATESGDPALFEKVPVFWKPKDRPPIREIYRGLLKLRAEYPAFHNDRVVWLKNSDESNLVTFMRLDEKDEFVIVINFSNRPQFGKVEVMNSQQFKPVTPGAKDAPAGFPVFELNGFGYRIYHREVKR